MAFVVGFGVGCALVRTRPVRGKAVLAVLPLWTRIPNNRWEKENRSGLLEVDSDPSTPLKERFVTTGSTLRKHSPAANIPLLTLMVDDTAQSESEPLAVLKGAFKLLLPLYNASKVIRRAYAFNVSLDTAGTLNPGWLLMLILSMRLP